MKFQNINYDNEPEFMSLDAGSNRWDTEATLDKIESSVWVIIEDGKLNTNIKSWNLKLTAEI